MGTHARLEAGHVSIDALAWLEERTGGPLPDLTVDLQAWGDRARTTGDEPLPWADVVPLWLRHRRYRGADRTDPGVIGVITHYGTRLDAELWIARATTADGPIAVVLFNDDLPVVYDDATSDSTDWYDADSVEIYCPNGHGWTWLSGRELVDAEGAFTTVTDVFGPGPHAPFSAVPRDPDQGPGRRPAPDPMSTIVCPTCRACCDVELPRR